MRCTSPRTVGYQSDGKTLCWSKRHFNKEYATFQLPCGKCLECRLEYARHWAIRCIHESKMHPKNSFVTLTYSDEQLKSPKLIYSDFQKFMKKLRKLQNDPIGVFVTGEYGEKNKRPHWHCLLFNFEPSDGKLKYTTPRGDKVFTSETLQRLWGKGFAEFGSVTFESAGYCARYAAKKLVHGKDGHEYEPISKKSSKHAIGKKFLERYWTDVFSRGTIVLPNGRETTIPRYYEKWFKENHPDAYLKYLTGVKLKNSERAIKKAETLKKEFDENNARRLASGKLTFCPSPLQHRKLITTAKFTMLQSYLKL